VRAGGRGNGRDCPNASMISLTKVIRVALSMVVDMLDWPRGVRGVELRHAQCESSKHDKR